MQLLAKKFPKIQERNLAFFVLAWYNASMKKNTEKNIGKVYPFRFNAVGILLCVLGLLLSSVGVGLSIYRIVTQGFGEGITEAIQNPFLIAVSLLCAVVIVSILIKSEFIVTSEELITRFVFVKSALPLSAITKMEHDRTTHKLTVYCGEEFSVFTLKKEWADELVGEMRKANPQIEFFFTMTENKPPKDGKKKKEKSDDKKDE